MGVGTVRGGGVWSMLACSRLSLSQSVAVDDAPCLSPRSSYSHTLQQSLLPVWMSVCVYVPSRPLYGRREGEDKRGGLINTTK